MEDEEYPPLLREIYDPPIVLYVKGSLKPGDRNALAIVGSRQTTAYGNEIARRFGLPVGLYRRDGGERRRAGDRHFGPSGCIGSGRADRGSMGTGINLVFPSENRDLFERIASTGAVMTQFPFNRPADKQSFPSATASSRA